MKTASPPQAKPAGNRHVENRRNLLQLEEVIAVSNRPEPPLALAHGWSRHDGRDRVRIDMRCDAPAVLDAAQLPGRRSIESETGGPALRFPI